ncbi:MAG: PBP1A family penicillin-binding protein [Candidatus Uhrbacteria bacterium]|nr:PBP1A family penicillin-binding protein [Candidatus Uhrbacteria bacterium]
MPIKHLHEPLKLNQEKRKGKNIPWKRVATIIGIGIAGLGLLSFLILTISLAWMSKDLPDPNTLLDRNVAQSTKIYDRTGQVLLYEIHGDEKRTLISIDQIPASIQHATVAIEDKRFYTHHGISWRDLTRAFLMSILKRQRVQGTSTLTQQFVKNAVLTNERSVTRKLKEVLLSLQIERKYSKDQILQLYLNEIPYGSNLYGIESAAQGYFGKSIRDVTLDEAALLASLPQGPDTYNPYGTGAHGDNRERLVGRQKYVLDQMAEQGYISKEEAEEAKKVDTLKKLIPQQVGSIKAPHFVMMVRSELVEKYGQRTVETGGLKVITTLDWDKQQMAEKAVTEGVEKRGEKYGFTNSALVSLDPKNGNILAMVGSQDFFNDDIQGKVNVALRPRQPGSSFKPIVYAAGFMKGYLPQTVLWDVKTSFPTGSGPYNPNNYDFKEHGPISIRMALQGSLNIPAVKMLYLVGVKNAIDFAEKLGYSTFGNRDRFGLSLVLGGGEVELLEHVSAYGAFATEGIHHPTVSLLKVENPDGSVLEEWKASEGTRAMDAQIAKLTSDVLSDNNARTYIFGARNSLTLPGRPVAAKTGTTNDYVDAWTVGYTPSLVTGVWVGNSRGGEEGKMKRGADGSVIAAPIWQQYMTDALKGSPVESFNKPDASNTTKSAILGTAFEKKVKIDTVSGKLATEFTPPELIEEKTFYEPHSILHYINIDDPTGPVPEHPEQDPQYNAWEQGVKAWVEKEQWNTTSTPPTEYDDVHTKDTSPTVMINSPMNNADIKDRAFTVDLNISASRPIRSVKAITEGYVLGASYTPADGQGRWTISAETPNGVEKGFHTLSVEAEDDVGNRGIAKITINLLAETEQVSIRIKEPQPGSSVSLDQFPISVRVQAEDISDISRADLYLQTPDGERRLIGSSIGPSDPNIQFNWSYTQGPGIYILQAEVAKSNGTKSKSDRASIIVTPSKKTSIPMNETVLILDTATSTEE